MNRHLRSPAASDEGDVYGAKDRLRRSPSSAEIAAQRQSDPSRLPKLLRGELDWIVMKALEKERARRYETANAFARDLERYLAGERWKPFLPLPRIAWAN